jgi:hypothetical protein
VLGKKLQTLLLLGAARLCAMPSRGAALGGMSVQTQLLV